MRELPDVGERVPELENVLADLIGQIITVGVAFGGRQVTRFERKADSFPIFTLHIDDVTLRCGVVVRVESKE